MDVSTRYEDRAIRAAAVNAAASWISTETTCIADVCAVADVFATYIETGHYPKPADARIAATHGGAT